MDKESTHHNSSSSDGAQLPREPLGKRSPWVTSSGAPLLLEDTEKPERTVDQLCLILLPKGIHSFGLPPPADNPLPVSPPTQEQLLSTLVEDDLHLSDEEDDEPMLQGQLPSVLLEEDLHLSEEDYEPVRLIATVILLLSNTDVHSFSFSVSPTPTIVMILVQSKII